MRKDDRLVDRQTDRHERKGRDTRKRVKREEGNNEREKGIIDRPVL